MEPSHYVWPYFDIIADAGIDLDDLKNIKSLHVNDLLYYASLIGITLNLPIANNTQSNLIKFMSSCLKNNRELISIFENQYSNQIEVDLINEAKSDEYYDPLTNLLLPNTRAYFSNIFPLTSDSRYHYEIAYLLYTNSYYDNDREERLIELLSTDGYLDIDEPSILTRKPGPKAYQYINTDYQIVSNNEVLYIVMMREIERFRQVVIKPTVVDKTPKGKGKKKTTIPKKVREDLWRRYFPGNFVGACQVCSDEFDALSAWHAGHITSEAKGGSTTLDNLAPICAECNLGMRTHDMRDWARKYYPNAPILKGEVIEEKDNSSEISDEPIIISKHESPIMQRLLAKGKSLEKHESSNIVENQEKPISPRVLLKQSSPVKSERPISPRSPLKRGLSKEFEKEEEDINVPQIFESNIELYRSSFEIDGYKRDNNAPFPPLRRLLRYSELDPDYEGLDAKIDVIDIDDIINKYQNKFNISKLYPFSRNPIRRYIDNKRLSDGFGFLVSYIMSGTMTSKDESYLRGNPVFDYFFVKYDEGVRFPLADDVPPHPLSYYFLIDNDLFTTDTNWMSDGRKELFSIIRKYYPTIDHIKYNSYNRYGTEISFAYIMSDPRPTFDGVLSMCINNGIHNTYMMLELIDRCQFKEQWLTIQNGTLISYQQIPLKYIDYLEQVRLHGNIDRITRYSILSYLVTDNQYLSRLDTSPNSDQPQILDNPTAADINLMSEMRRKIYISIAGIERNVQWMTYNPYKPEIHKFLKLTIESINPTPEYIIEQVPFNYIRDTMHPLIDIYLKMLRLVEDRDKWIKYYYNKRPFDYVYESSVRNEIDRIKFLPRQVRQSPS